jgi:hypothetical protein
MTQTEISNLPIAYLVEATDVTNTGNLQGKSLRCYEVRYDTTGTAKWGGTDTKFYPTGKMYVLQDGEIKCKSTKATLNNKHLGWRNPTKIHSTIDSGIQYWHCSLFVSPDIALIAKHRAIQSRVAQVKSDIQKQLDAITKTEFEIPDISKLESEHPEYFI